MIKEEKEKAEIVGKMRVETKEGQQISYYIATEYNKYFIVSRPLMVALDKSKFPDLKTLEEHYRKKADKYGSTLKVVRW